MDGFEDGRVRKTEQVQLRLAGIAAGGEALPRRHDEHVAAAHLPLPVAHGDRARPSKTWNTAEPTSRLATVVAPLCTRCISQRMVGSTSRPFVDWCSARRRGRAQRGGIAFGFQRQLLVQGPVRIHPAVGQQRGDRGSSRWATGRRPGWAHRRSERECRGVARSCGSRCRRPCSKNCDSP